MFSIITGIEIGSLLNSSRYVYYESGESAENTNGYKFDKTVMNFTIGASFRYFFSPKFYLGIQPSIRRNLTPNEGINGYSGKGSRFSWGIQFAFGYKLSPS